MLVINLSTLLENTMRHLSFKFAMLSLALMAMVGCSKEQSSLEIQDIPGKAKILGSFSYDAGQGYSNGVYVQLIKPAANVKVVVKVDNSSLSPNGKATGYTYYETTTDEQGAYEVQVPAVDKGTIVMVAPEPFFETYTKVVSVDNGTPVSEKEEKLYKISPETRNVTPNDIQIFDAKYTDQERDIEEPYKYNSTFVVKVGKPICEKEYDYNSGSYTIEKKYGPAVGQDVVVKVGDYYYGATADSEGCATFVIPSEKKAWSTSVQIGALAYTGKFTYYAETYDYYGEREVTEHKIPGTFEQSGSDAVQSVTFKGIDGVPAPVVKVRMLFRPFEGEETYGYSAYDWNYLSW